MSAEIWDQLAIDTPAVPKRTDDTCTACGATVRRIIAGDTAGLPAVVSHHPAPRATALAAIVTGRPAYVHRQHKRATSWVRLDADNIGSKHVATGDHHLEHVCGHDPPKPPPAADFIPDYTGPPPF